ncbi:hypothetical protein VE25_02265 [Devosia geojensis]|uniref:Uncharacterized protein n=1 Tax=Devosia geojensis TaxID=443610 RepID=A0A0F5FWU3_9HYPH|nr:hypothetical protein [Devosia geojensis]KKB13303.1 hypothetical protein VE25_02265 [Devosia geojensis]
MPDPREERQPEVAKVDRLVDEQGSPIEVPENSGLKPADLAEASVGATSPTRWWAYGLVGLAVVIAILFLLQIFSGAPSTEVQPGTPVSEPVVEPPAAPQ